MEEAIDEQQIQLGRASRELVSADVVELILTRLPVKSLFRFKSVSKSWNQTISNRGFALAHLYQSRNNPSLPSYRNIFLVWSLHKEAYSLSKLTENDELKPLLDLKSGFSFEKEQCCCDGLMLVYSTVCTKSGITVWNPSARTYTDLGFPFPDRNPVTCGIGFDPLSKDYKIVALEWFNERYAVFNNSTRGWSELKSPEITFEDDIKNFPFDGDMVYLHSWIDQQGESETASYNIEMHFYNLRDDKFYKFFYNTGRGSRTRTSYCLVDCSSTQFCVLLGDVHLDKCRIVWKKKGGEWVEVDDLPIPWTELWMGNDYMWYRRMASWRQRFSKMYVIDYNDRELMFTIQRPDNTCFIIYNLIEKKFRVVLKSDDVVYERPLIGYSDNLFFST
ncbi:putative F-box protein At3g16210 [Andrographis paniculata]|uniref:putative F-box protein At3g16210 n=1 Tax=Andrographis paniculata TaxID=175694 RepID=UPI0021E7C4F2|nr:putative F-box protein At3g16210 [Andrographis paniculata]